MQASTVRNRMSSGLELNDTLLTDIDRGVDVAVMDRVTGWTRPAPNVQWQGVYFMIAVRTGFTTGIPLIEFNNVLTCSLSFVRQLTYKF